MAIFKKNCEVRGTKSMMGRTISILLDTNLGNTNLRRQWLCSFEEENLCGSDMASYFVMH